MPNNQIPGVTDEGLSSELTARFSETAGALFSAGSTEATLQRVVDLAVATIEGCDWAGIFVLEGGHPGGTVTTVVKTDPLVVKLDGLQHFAGEGPCLDAIGAGTTFYAEDLADEDRWPAYGPLAVEAGARSLLAMRLQSTDLLGALILYARYPRAFGVIDRAKGVILASLAGLAVSFAQAHENEERRLENLAQALGTRGVIGQAQGILMERERVSADQAFDILRQASQHLNLKLRDVAQTLVDTGVSPSTKLPSDP